MARGVRKRRRWPWIALAVVVALGAIMFWVMFLPPFHVSEIVSQPEFCGTCHNMNPQLRAFQTSRHRALDSCNDCHLPNDNVVSHYVADAYVGTRDLISFYVLGRAPYDAQATERSKDWILDNCIRCHGDIVEWMPADQDCWECHRTIYHRFQLRRVNGEDEWTVD